MPKLKIVQGNFTGAEFDLPEQGTITLGRRSTCDIQVPDAKASRVHAEVVATQGYWYVRDLGSRNGTRVNGRRLDKNALEVFEAGDRLEIGDTVLEMIEVRAAEELAVEVPGYEIIERIGSGGMGTVYKAKQVSMDRVVALKMLREELCRDPDFIQRFVQEARAAGKLSHPNIVHVFDVNRAGDAYYFSMEYVDGGNVKRLLKSKGRIEPARAVEIIVRAARALAYAHAQGIVHRDIKPDNLMLTRDNDVKLADLGIARTFEEQDESGRPTRVYGTPHYMAPEQALGKPVDARVDVYSLGATLYHMLTGRTPFGGTTATEVLKAHIQEELPPITEFAGDVPEALCHVCERMMAKKPERRYQNMEEVIGDLEKIKADAGAKIAAPGLGESSVIPAATPAAAEFRRRRACLRRPTWQRAAGMGGMLAVLAVLGVAAYLVTRALASSPPTVTTGTADPQEARREAERAFADCVRREEARAFEAAMVAFTEFIYKHPEYPELVEDARTHVGRLRGLLAEQQRTEAQDAYEEATRWHNSHPGEIDAAVGKFGDIVRRWPDTPAAALAKQKMQELDAYRGKQQDALMQRNFEVAKAKVGALLVERKYDEAIQAFNVFAAQYPGAEVAQATQTEVQRLEKEVEEIYRRHETEAKGYAAAGRYGPAVKILDAFMKDYGSVQWRTEAQKYKDRLQSEGMKKFQELSKEPTELVKAYRFEEAITKYQMLRTQFDGTQWGNFAAVRLQSIQKQEAIHSKVIHKIRVQKEPPRLPFTLKGFVGTRFRIVGADEKGITVESETAPKVRQPVAWTEMPPAEVYQVYRLYISNPAEEEHVGLGYFCQERDLVDKADEHFQKGGM